MRPDVLIAKIAGHQHHVFTHEQALGAGFSSSAIKRRFASGLWLPMHRGVYVMAGVPIGWEQRMVAAMLACGPGAALSCCSAGQVWALFDGPTDPHVVIGGADRRTIEGVTVHRSWTSDAVSYRGFRLTNPMRTLLDMGAYVSEERLEIALDEALRRSLVAVPRLTTYLGCERNRARRGAGVLRSLVMLRSAGRPIGSGGETKLFRFLRRHGLPLPVPQFPVEARSGTRYADFAYPDVKVAIEFDSWEYHSARIAFDAERARRNELEELGWHVLQITSEYICRQPLVAATTVGASLGLVPARWKPG